MINFANIFTIHSLAILLHANTWKQNLPGSLDTSLAGHDAPWTGSGNKVEIAYCLMHRQVNQVNGLKFALYIFFYFHKYFWLLLGEM